MTPAGTHDVCASALMCLPVYIRVLIEGMRVPALDFEFRSLFGDYFVAINQIFIGKWFIVIFIRKEKFFF